ncbi:MAG: thioredoxin domain-containing protein, partial [Elusimicrobia bacterium]|nr:thioredoxin domain-containing protein [Elusimicrobiota bacterium]
KLTLKHLPWGFHKWAKTAAIMSECAGEQDKFWEYADMLFDSQKQWSPIENPMPIFISFAEKLNLDKDAFLYCAYNPQTFGSIKFQAYESANIASATPTFVINGKKIIGADALKEYFAMETNGQK